MVFALPILLGACALVSIVFYNRLVRGRNQYKNAFAQIDVQLKRRHDLIPNLVETARSYLKHERETLEAVISARNASHSLMKGVSDIAADPNLVGQLAAAESTLSGALGRLLAVAESYPDLKANENMAQLSEELTSTENRIAYARQAYNDVVMRYNTSRESFPGNIFAGFFGFDPASLYESTDAERAVPPVSFDR